MRLEGLRLWLQVEALQLGCCLQAVSFHWQSRCSSCFGGFAEGLQEATMHWFKKWLLLSKVGVWQALEWVASEVCWCT